LAVLRAKDPGRKSCIRAEIIEIPAGTHDDDHGWTIREVELPPRRPVTLDTVRLLLRDGDLRDVARVALKYSK